MRKLINALGTIGIAATASLTAQAAEETFQATVDVLTPITITETQQLSFGKIIAPDNGSSNLFYTSGAPVGGSGNGSYISGVSLGKVSIDGNDGETASFDFTEGDCSDAVNLTLSNLPNPSQSILDYNLTYNGVLTVQSGTPAGAYTCDYTVTANYQ